MSSSSSSSPAGSPTKKGAPFVPPKLTKATTMMETAAVGKEFLEHEGHTEFAPLAKSSERRVTRSQHKLRSTVEELLTDLPEPKKPRRTSGGAKKSASAEGTPKKGASATATATTTTTTSPDGRKAYEDQLRMVFRLFDPKNKGEVKTDEILTVMHNLGKRPRKERVAKILQELDPNKTGHVSRDAFVAYMVRKRFGVVATTTTTTTSTSTSTASTFSTVAGVNTAGAMDVESDDDDEPEIGGVNASTLANRTNVAALLRKGSNIADFYNVSAGVTEEGGHYIEGAEYDLGRNEAFSSFSVIMYNFAEDAASPFFYSLQEPCQALTMKGFQTITAANLEQFLEALPNCDEAWIASSEDASNTDVAQMDKLIAELRKFHQSGKGIAIFAGGAPANGQATDIANGLLNGVAFEDANNGGQRLLISATEDAGAGYIARDLLSTGIVSMFEGQKYSSIAFSKGANSNTAAVKKLATSRDDKTCIVTVEGTSNQGRILLDGGLERFMPGDTWDQQTRRYCSNVAVWLLGLENRMKLNARLAGDVSDKEIKCTWEYFLDRHLDGKAPGFHRYSDDAAKIVETAFLKYLGTDQTGTNIRSYCTVKSGQFTYEVDFKTMTQRNVAHPNHTMRPVRRVEL